MSLAGKIFAVICMLLAVFYAGITAALMSLQENYKQRWVDEQRAHAQTKQDLETQLADEKERLKQTEGERAQLEGERNELRGEVTQLRADWAAAAGVNRLAMAVINDQEDQIAALNDRVKYYNDALTTQRTSNDTLKTQVEELEADVAEKVKSRDALRDLLTVREQDLTNAVKEVEKLTNDLAIANDMLMRLKERDPETYAGLLRPEMVLRPKEVIRGKVTGVDKSLGLVIINVGQRHKVIKGYTFIVFRGDEYVGKVIVDEVFPDMAATHYDKPTMKSDVEVGDDVTTRLSIDL